MTQTITDCILTEERAWIGGAWTAGEAGTREVIDPARGAPFAGVAECSPAQVEAAIEAAARAQPEWGRRAPLERAAIMAEVARLIRHDAEALARIVVREQGKPIGEARGEVAGAAEFFDFFAGYARRIQGEILPSDVAGEQVWIQRVPWAWWAPSSLGTTPRPSSSGRWRRP